MYPSHKQLVRSRMPALIRQSMTRLRSFNGNESPFTEMQNLLLVATYAHCKHTFQTETLNPKVGGFPIGKRRTSMQEPKTKAITTKHTQ